MRTRGIVAAGLLAIVLTVAGCSAIERFFTPPAAGGDSPAVGTGRVLDQVLPDPWGEVALAGIIAVQNLYLARQKLKARKAKTKPAA